MSDQEESSILDSEEDEESAPKPKRENSTIRQMRETIEERDARLKELEERTTRYEKTFLESAGLTEKQSNALKAAGYEATPEGIENFRSEVLGITAEAEAPASEDTESEEEESPDVTPEQAGFAPTQAGGAKPPQGREYTSNDIVAMMKSDPAKADKLLRSGKVVRKEFHPGGPAF